MTHSQRNASRPWRPAPVVRASIFLHAIGVICVVIHPVIWPWALALLALNQLILIAAVLVPTGTLLGPNRTHLPQSAVQRGEVALTFDDGPDPDVTLQVLDLLDQYQAKATFFCIGSKIAAYPNIAQEIVRRGHHIENHSQHHSYLFALYSISKLQREVLTAQSAIAGITGRFPIFFRAPAGFRSPLLDIVMARCGMHYVSWTRRGLDGVQSDPALVLQRLLHNLRAGDILLLHDVSRDTRQAPAVLTVLPALLHQMAQQKLKSVSLAKAFGDNLND